MRRRRRARLTGVASEQPLPLLLPSGGSPQRVAPTANALPVLNSNMIKWKAMRRRAAYLGLCALMLTACSGLPQLDLSEIIVRAAATPVVVIEDTDATPVPATLSTAALVKRRSAVRIGFATTHRRWRGSTKQRVGRDGRRSGARVRAALAGQRTQRRVRASDDSNSSGKGR